VDRAGNLIRIGGHELDLARGVLTRDGAPVHLRAKSFALLCYLVAQRGRVVGKQELLDAVWPEVTVTEDSLTQAIRDLRRVLGDGAVRTEARRGYATVTETAAAPVRAMSLILRPAEVPTGGAPGAAFQAEVASSLAAALGRYSLITLRAEGRTDFVLRLAARRSGRDMTLSVQLEGTDQVLVWGETHRLPRRAMTQTLGALAHRVTSRMLLDTARHGEALPLAERSPVQLLAIGIGGVHASGQDEVARVIACLDAAIAADPGLVLARSYRAEARVLHAAFGEDPDAMVEEVLGDARLAVAQAPDEARCHRVLSVLLGWRGDLDGAEMAARQALRLNPWDADCMAHLGVIVTQRGNPAEGLTLMEAAADLNPLHPEWFHHQFALAHYLLGDPAAALAHLEAWSRQSPWRFLRAAACAAALGDIARAQRHLAAARALSPGFDPVAIAGEIYGFERPDDKARLLADLATALAAEG
jgi:DNA-binding winged helix-turn-helix (wHTH) protein/tetratricopeptide (TPR) repeat protein